MTKSLLTAGLRTDFSAEEIRANHVDLTQLVVEHVRLRREAERQRFFVFKALDDVGLTTEERLYLCGDAVYDNSWRDMWHGLMRAT